MKAIDCYFDSFWVLKTFIGKLANKIHQFLIIAVRL